MDQASFIQECQRIFDQNHLSCSNEQAERLYLLTIRMLEVNKYMNLTAITEEKSIILRHYVDSITTSEHLPNNASVIDVGCGAGFPTLPLAIFRPDLSITALDGTAKRIRYVQQTADELELKNVNAIAGRAEEYAQNHQFREKFDVATARAVAALPTLSELCLGFVRVGGQMIAMKSLHADEELTQSQRGISLCGGTFLKKIETHLICDEAESEQRTLLFIQKTQSTPKIYPRHFSKISKNPL